MPNSDTKPVGDGRRDPRTIAKRRENMRPRPMAELRAELATLQTRFNNQGRENMVFVGSLLRAIGYGCMQRETFNKEQRELLGALYQVLLHVRDVGFYREPHRHTREAARTIRAIIDADPPPITVAIEDDRREPTMPSNVIDMLAWLQAHVGDE